MAVSLLLLVWTTCTLTKRSEENLDDICTCMSRPVLKKKNPGNKTYQNSNYNAAQLRAQKSCK